MLTWWEHLTSSWGYWRQKWLHGRFLVLLACVVALQVLGLLGVQVARLTQIVQTVLSPDYSYALMREQYADMEFVDICQRVLPEETRLLHLIEYDDYVKYHLFPRYNVSLGPQWRKDTLIARDIKQHAVTHVVIWEPGILEQSELLQNEQLFERTDYGKGRWILRVTGSLP